MVQFNTFFGIFILAVPLLSVVAMPRDTEASCHQGTSLDAR
jgi:hypothetical protein